MIISASRRTDIPAFYMPWLLNRLREGFVLVRNPMNPRQVSRVPLNANTTECIVFWTKNPEPMIPHIAEIERLGFRFYVQVTLTPYQQDIEPNVPDKATLIETFKVLSNIIGKHRMVWRYDPIIITDNLEVDFHTKSFEHLATELTSFCTKCTISFVDPYKKALKNMPCLKQFPIPTEMRLSLASKLAAIATRFALPIESCAEETDLTIVGVKSGSCIDSDIISKIMGQVIEGKKDKNQRESCNCIESVDIGTYNTCRHGCRYCYANSNENAVKQNVMRHDPQSPLLVGSLMACDKVSERIVGMLRAKEITLF